MFTKGKVWGSLSATGCLFQGPSRTLHLCSLLSVRRWILGNFRLIRWCQVTGPGPRGLQATLAPAGTAGVISQQGVGGGGWNVWAQGRTTQLVSSTRYHPGLGPLPGRSHPTPFLSCRILIRVVGAGVSYRLLPRGCSCSARSMDRKKDARMDRWTQETRRLRSSAPCRLWGGTAGRAVPPYYSLVSRSP